MRTTNIVPRSSPRETMKGELLRLLQADLPLDVRRAAEEVLARLDVQQLLPGTRASVDGPLFLAHFEFPLNHEGRPHNVRVTLQGKSPGAEGLLRLFFLLESNHLGRLGFAYLQREKSQLHNVGQGPRCFELPPGAGGALAKAVRRLL